MHKTKNKNPCRYYYIEVYRARTRGNRHTFKNKERVEKVKMASQQMPSASGLFLDLASALRVCFLPFEGLGSRLYQRVDGGKTEKKNIYTLAFITCVCVCVPLVLQK